VAENGYLLDQPVDRGKVANPTVDEIRCQISGGPGVRLRKAKARGKARA
jgi:hypothetical protein